MLTQEGNNGQQLLLNYDLLGGLLWVAVQLWHTNEAICGGECTAHAAPAG